MLIGPVRQNRISCSELRDASEQTGEPTFRTIVLRHRWSPAPNIAPAPLPCPSCPEHWPNVQCQSSRLLPSPLQRPQSRDAWREWATFYRERYKPSSTNHQLRLDRFVRGENLNRSFPIQEGHRRCRRSKGHIHCPRGSIQRRKTIAAQPGIQLHKRETHRRLSPSVDRVALTPPHEHKRGEHRQGQEDQGDRFQQTVQHTSWPPSQPRRGQLNDMQSLCVYYTRLSPLRGLASRLAHFCTNWCSASPGKVGTRGLATPRLHGNGIR